MSKEMMKIKKAIAVLLDADEEQFEKAAKKVNGALADAVNANAEFFYIESASKMLSPPPGGRPVRGASVILP